VPERWVDKWKIVAGAFGPKDALGTSVRSEWGPPDLWLRRQFELDDAPLVDPLLLMNYGTTAKGAPVRTAPLVCLLDEETDLPPKLGEHQDRSVATIVEKDAANGHRFLAVTPVQSHSPKIADWSFAITEKPAPGEYRYLRFAWRKPGGGGIMLQVAQG